MKNLLSLSAVFTLSTLLFVSCTKEDVIEAADNSPLVASSVSIDVANELDIQTGTEISSEQLTARRTGKSLTGSCGTVTIQESANFPKTVYVDFGTGCTANGVVRKGKLKITFSNYITETNSVMTIERENYYVNGNKVEGKIEYKNTTETAGVPQWTRTVIGGILTDTKGDVYLNSGSYTVKQTEGAGTVTITDNTYEMIQGSHTTSKQNGGTITLTVVTPLVKKFSCDFISKGTLKVESTLLSGTIDYGNGDCDNKATYTQNGIAFPIEM